MRTVESRLSEFTVAQRGAATAEYSIVCTFTYVRCVDALKADVGIGLRRRPTRGRRTVRMYRESQYLVSGCGRTRLMSHRFHRLFHAHK
jgi:hypothetical protein